MKATKSRLITILGVVEGETRGLTSVLTVAEMFNAQDKFKADLVERVQAQLELFGLKVYCANTKETQQTLEGIPESTLAEMEACAQRAENMRRTQAEIATLQYQQAMAFFITSEANKSGTKTSDTVTGVELASDTVTSIVQDT